MLKMQRQTDTYTNIERDTERNTHRQRKRMRELQIERVCSSKIWKEKLCKGEREEDRLVQGWRVYSQKQTHIQRSRRIERELPTVPSKQTPVFLTPFHWSLFLGWDWFLLTHLALTCLPPSPPKLNFCCPILLLLLRSTESAVWKFLKDRGGWEGDLDKRKRERDIC